MYRRAAPAKDLPADWVLGVDGAEPVPLWIRPDRKITVADVMGYMRDHFQDTELDMTADVGAGPYGLPYRWRPLTWEVDGVEYFNERAVSTQQTGFSFVAQARSWLPDPIGGIFWFGVDDTASTVYFPAYCGATAVPESYAEGAGSFDDVDLGAAFWAFNQVANFTYLRWNLMMEDVRRVQSELESTFLAEVSEVDSAALALYERSPRLARDYLTDYSSRAGNAVVTRWRELYKHLLWKYLDGNVKDEHGDVTHPGYPESWYRMVADATDDRLQMRQTAAEREAAERETAEARKIGDAVITLLEARGVAVGDAVREQVASADDPGIAREWLVRAATAEDAAEVVAED